ncbi:Protein tyrosine phosphatase type IVA 1 [Boothiomyces sp. JEL0866]|nr:Protein tyrosine phosphatase type IVA 1 [Boothiomyces sp. JEL0866]
MNTLETIPMTNTPSNSSTLSTPPIPKSILTRMFSPVSIGHLRFIIMDCPTESSLSEYLKELKIRGVTDVVRVCEPTYDRNLLIEQNINVHDWPYPDGGIPPAQILTDYLTLVEARFGNITLSKEIIQDKTVTVVDHSPVIAVHCVAGLGRAPVLVAVALIEAGFAPLDAIDFIRKCRRGAFNAHQLKYLIDTYKKRSSKSSFSFLRRAGTPPKENEDKSFFSKVFKFKKSTPDIASQVEAN